MEALEHTKSAEGAISRVKYTHDMMIDFILANPGVKQNDLARAFGYTPAWISRITCSDAFQARLAARRGEIVTPSLLLSFEERLKGLATQSLDMLADRLDAVDEEGNSIAPTEVVIKALEISSKSLGYGARQTNVAIQNNVTVNKMSDEELLEIAQNG